MSGVRRMNDISRYWRVGVIMQLRKLTDMGIVLVFNGRDSFVVGRPI